MDNIIQIKDAGKKTKSKTNKKREEF